MNLVALSLGTNKGRRCSYMEEMKAGVRRILRPPVRFSPLMETEPVGVSGTQRWFLNCIVCGQFDGTPIRLLQRCLQLEEALGRERPYRFSPRTADVDILFFDSVVMNTERLTLPHPAVFDRRFCIEGLAQLVPDYVLPGRSRTFSDELKHMRRDVAEQKVYFR
ncbi:MAG: 2-amino-4-hydroxy-6-hydroxymethyldihydropteridine diphosphokinase [Chitinispirillaceae bacterium]